jgi:hypothetical protein
MLARILRRFLLPLLVLLLVPAGGIAAQSAAATTWTENWAGGSADHWVDSTRKPISCDTSGGTLHATKVCSPQAFSTAVWDHTQPVSLSGTVRGQVGTPTTNYFCGLALIEGTATSVNQLVYGQLYIGRNIPPAPTTYAGVGMFNDEGSRWSKWLALGGAQDPNAWQNFTIRWNPKRSNGMGYWSGTWNGVATPNIVSQVTQTLIVDLQGGPQAPAPDQCQFGTLSVTGVRLS